MRRYSLLLQLNSCPVQAQEPIKRHNVYSILRHLFTAVQKVHWFCIIWYTAHAHCTVWYNTLLYLYMAAEAGATASADDSGGPEGVILEKLNI